MPMNKLRINEDTILLINSETIQRTSYSINDKVVTIQTSLLGYFCHEKLYLKYKKKVMEASPVLRESRL